MPERIKIREISKGDDKELTAVMILFQDMYAYMDAHGLRINLEQNGAKKWMEGLKMGLGRFGILFIADDGNDIIGFAHGSLRLTPDYLGNRKVGVITHVHVKKEYWRKGVGERLVRKLEDWFREQEVHSVELQVLSRNKAGIAFWEKLGYTVELIQHRKMGKEL